MARLSNADPGIPLESPISRFLLDPLGAIARWAGSHGGATALALKAGAAALLVTHSERAAALADRILVLTPQGLEPHPAGGAH